MCVMATCEFAPVEPVCNTTGLPHYPLNHVPQPQEGALTSSKAGVYALQPRPRSRDPLPLFWQTVAGPASAVTLARFTEPQQLSFNSRLQTQRTKFQIPRQKCPQVHVRNWDLTGNRGLVQRLCVYIGTSGLCGVGSGTQGTCFRTVRS